MADSTITVLDTKTGIPEPGSAGGKSSVDLEPSSGSLEDHHVSATTWTKIDLVVLPSVALFYLLSSLDRSNIGNARIAGLQEDLRMSDNQYSFALTIPLIPYILIEIPSNNLMIHVSPRILLPTMVTLWGIAAALQGVVHNYAGILACRFFLGLFEGGILPGIFFYLSSFYPRRMLQFRASIVFSASAFASAFSGLLAAAIIHMEGVGGRPGWAWVFILEGLFTVAFGIASFFILPDRPASIRALRKDEKEQISNALHADGLLHHEDRASWTEFKRTFTQPQVVLLSIVGFFSGSTIFSLSFYLPTIVASLGFSGTKAQLMTVPPFAVSAVLSAATAILSDRFSQRGLSMIFYACISTAGFALFLASFSHHARYGSLFLAVTGTYCIGPTLGTWMANNTAPLTRRATGLALFTMLANVGAVLSTWLYGPISPAPRYTAATALLLGMQVCIALCAAVTRTYLARENKRKAQLRAEGGREGPPSPGVEIPNDSIWYEYVL